MALVSGVVYSRGLSVAGGYIFPGVVNLRGLYVFGGCLSPGVAYFRGLKWGVYVPYNYVGTRSLVRAEPGGRVGRRAGLSRESRVL